MTIKADVLPSFETEEFDPFRVRTTLSQGTRIDTKDVKLWCHDTGGEGEVVLLMGGFTAGHFAFDFTRQFLPAYRLLAWEPRGLGLSDRPDPAHNEYSAAVWAEDAINLLSALNIKKAHVWAQGFGGYVAVRLAAQRPDLVASLITSPEVWVGYEDRTTDWKMYSSIVDNLGTRGRGARLLAQWMDSGSLPWFVRWEARNIEEVVHAEMVRATVGYGLLDADIRQDLPRVKAPTHVILGAPSATDPPVHAGIEEMRRNISEFDVVTIEGADEAYGIVTHPEEFAAAARQVFEAHPIGPEQR